MTSTPSTAQSLYRTWRSRTFAEVVGQGHITQTLRNAVRHGSVGHAYLLTGPRGTGKTSTARILARAVNCLQPRDGEPCNECAPCRSILSNHCLDVVEIDAASRSKVDEMRDVIDKVGYAPTEVRRKVYIVDEVHMLSQHAFNALLKTIEEPPAHVIFCLATTEVHKVPATITSRCQRLDFRTISLDDIVERLAFVCAQEGLQAEPAALETIARQATGSLRDALSLLEQVRAYEDVHIDVATVEDALGLARREALARLTDDIMAGDAGGALALIGELAAAGADMRQYAKQLVQYWRDLLLLRVASGQPGPDAIRDPVMAAQASRLSPADITFVLKTILQPDYSGRRSASPQLQLDLAVAEASIHFAPGAASSPSTRSVEGGALTSPVATRPVQAVETGKRPDGPASNGRDAGGATSAAPAVVAAPTVASGQHEMPEQPEQTSRPPAAAANGATSAHATLAQAPAAAREPAPHTQVSIQESGSGADAGDARRVWAQVRQHPAVKGKRSLSTLLNGSCIAHSLQDDSFVLLFYPKNKWHREQVEAGPNRAAIEEALQAVVGRPVTLRCDTLKQQATDNGKGPQAPEPDPYIDEAARRLRAIHVEQ